MFGWGCSRCGRRDGDAERPGHDDRTNRIARNCDAETNPSVYFETAPLEHRGRCPWSQVTDSPELALVLDWYQTWSLMRALPFGGELSDQPLYVAQAISSLASQIESRRNAMKQEQIEKHEALMRQLEKQAKRGGRG